ncbi:hypothetical protein D7B24_000563 [Verticillium nonalfalfae]|uniref:Xylanolytic transcriptional activator regulatory domain-containing protein n=1 Tax=Verticillium nonalfalfae TaxID=1051616 RepID=A0A3M9Y228_9PEZI|nr:uncharacterized protein D7B24_000563 [Verticillium nonalfalfae]RNJ54334.1 hypothetical protein D7B24_000563 [Verticillium nonalfalfae]
MTFLGPARSATSYKLFFCTSLWMFGTTHIRHAGAEVEPHLLPVQVTQGRNSPLRLERLLSSVHARLTGLTARPFSSSQSHSLGLPLENSSEKPESGTAISVSPGQLSIEQRSESPSVFRDSQASHGNSRPPQVQDVVVPPIREQLRLVNDFFQHVYPMPVYAFLNESSITQRCIDGTLDETLLLALLSCSALHLRYTKYFPVLTNIWVQRLEMRIWSQIEQPSIFLTQALMLVILYRMEIGNFQKAFMLCALATRAASALRLHYERTDLSPLAQEIRRRVLWCLMMVDAQFSVGLPECELCPYEVIYLEFPCKEEDFVPESEARSQSLDGIPEGGFLRQTVQQVVVRRDIMRLRRQVSLSRQAIPQLTSIVDDFQRNLQAMSPGTCTLEDVNTYSRSRWLARFIGTHLSWHQCHCDVSRMFLSGYKEAAPMPVIESLPAEYVAAAATQCLVHSQAILQILNDLSKLSPGLLVPHMDVAVCGYHASRLVLFLSRSPLNPDHSGLTPEIALAKASAVSVFLNRIFANSQIAKHLLADLERIVGLYLTGEREQSQDPSDTEEETPHQRPRFARAARQHQRLGIHSMLRQARFVDDSDRAAELPETEQAGARHLKDLANAGLHTHSLGSRHPSGVTQPMQTLPCTDQPATRVSLVTADLTLNLADDLASGFDFGGESFGLGTPDGWHDIWSGHEHSNSADRDYF